METRTETLISKPQEKTAAFEKVTKNSEKMVNQATQSFRELLLKLPSLSKDPISSKQELISALGFTAGVSNQGEEWQKWFAEKFHQLEGQIGSFVQGEKEVRSFLARVFPENVKGRDRIISDLAGLARKRVATPETILETAAKILNQLKTKDSEQKEVLGVVNLFASTQAQGAEGEGGQPSSQGGEAQSSQEPPGLKRARELREKFTQYLGRQSKPTGIGELSEEEISKLSKGELVAALTRGRHARLRQKVLTVPAFVVLSLWGLLEVSSGFGPISDIVLPAIREVGISPSVVRQVEKVPFAGEKIAEEYYHHPEVEKLLATEDPVRFRNFVASLPDDAAIGSRGVSEFFKNLNKLQFYDQWTEELKREMAAFDYRVREDLLKFAKTQDPSVKNEKQVAKWLAEWLRQKYPSYSNLIEETEAMESVYVTSITGEPIPDDEFDQIKKLHNRVTGRNWR